MRSERLRCGTAILVGAAFLAEESRAILLVRRSLLSNRSASLTCVQAPAITVAGDSVLQSTPPPASRRLSNPYLPLPRHHLLIVIVTTLRRRSADTLFVAATDWTTLWISRVARKEGEWWRSGKESDRCYEALNSSNGLCFGDMYGACGGAEREQQGCWIWMSFVPISRIVAACFEEEV